MPDYQLAAKRAARKYGLDPDIYSRQIGAESNFNPKAKSPAGAGGIAQIMPKTAEAWGVNLNDGLVSDDLDASAKHMADYVRKYGSYEAALRAYNAGEGAIERSKGFSETNDYVKRILQGTNPSTLVKPGNQEVNDASSRVSSLSQLTGTTKDTSQEPSVFDVIRRYAIATDTDLTDEQRSTEQSLLDAAMRANQVTPSTPKVSLLANRTPTPKGTSKFKITGPNPGRLQPVLVDFAEQVASQYGRSLSGSDGSGHSHLTVNGNVSQHSTGNATDIPASGQDLIEIGQAALIAAGMPEAEARKRKGGLFNVGTHQIIFNTHEGGDHTDHLHISAK